MDGYGLTGKRLQPARLRNLYGGLQLRETTAAYGGLRRRLRGLKPSNLPIFGFLFSMDERVTAIVGMVRVVLRQIWFSLSALKLAL